MNSPKSHGLEVIAQSKVIAHSTATEKVDGLSGIPGVIDPWAPAASRHLATHYEDIAEVFTGNRDLQRALAIASAHQAGALVSARSAAATALQRQAKHGAALAALRDRRIRAEADRQAAMAGLDPGWVAVHDRDLSQGALQISGLRIALASGIASGVASVGVMLAVVAILNRPLQPNPYIAATLALGGLVLVATFLVALSRRRLAS